MSGALTVADIGRVVDIIGRALASIGISKSGKASGYLVDAQLLCAINFIQIEPVEKEVSG